MSNENYGVENGHGDFSGQGMTQRKAREMAQHEANGARQTRYVVDLSRQADDGALPEDAVEAIEPE